VKVLMSEKKKNVIPCDWEKKHNEEKNGLPPL
jgi:hypothetical protein